MQSNNATAAKHQGQCKATMRQQQSIKGNAKQQCDSSKASRAMQSNNATAAKHQGQCKATMRQQQCGSSNATATMRQQQCSSNNAAAAMQQQQYVRPHVALAFMPSSVAWPGDHSDAGVGSSAFSTNRIDSGII